MDKRIIIKQTNPLLWVIRHKFFPPLFYILSGLSLFYSLIIIFYTYVVRLKVEAAVVNTQIETMVAPVGGYITDVYVQLDQHVKKNSPLLKIENIDLERRLLLAKVRLDESKLAIDYYQQLLKNEQQRLNVYKKISQSRIQSAQAVVNVSHQQVNTNERELKRYIELHKKHYVSESNLEEIRTKYENSKDNLQNALAQQNIEHQSLKTIKKGMYFTGNKAEGIGRDLHAKLVSAKNRAVLNEDRVKIYERLINKLIIAAPFDGKITQILKSAGNTTDNIKPIIFIEKIKADKTVVAYLTQDEVIHIGASAKVKIYVPSSGKTYHGNIMKIDRTDGFIDTVKAQYQWRDFQVDRSAMVTLALQTDEQKKFNKQVFSGVPVVVYFKKKWAFF